MTVKTCLLITDDMDDHQTMSEAIDGISGNTVLLNVIDSHKALKWLRDGNYRPDYIILDLSMRGIKANSILKVIRDGSAAANIPTIIYGFEDQFEQVNDTQGLHFFKKDYNFSELKGFLMKIISPD